MAFYILKRKFIDGREEVITATQSLKRARILQKTLDVKMPEMIIETVNENGTDILKYWCVSFSERDFADCYIVSFGNDIPENAVENAVDVGIGENGERLTDVYVIAKSRETATFKAREMLRGYLFLKSLRSLEGQR